MTEPLEAPRSVDDLYLARSADSLSGTTIFRPIMTGDVFRDVKIYGVDDEEGDQDQLAMIVSHPCSMRSGWKLNDRVQAVRVTKTHPVQLNEWPKRHYDRMPLPELTLIAESDKIASENFEAEYNTRLQEGSYAAMFDKRGRIESSNLDLNQRVACLSEEGLALMHQRMGHFDTRYAPEIETLIGACAPVLTEIDLWEDWNKKLIAPECSADPVRLRQELDRIAELFDTELSQKRPIPGKKNGFYVLRDDLKNKKRQSGAQREIVRIMQEHFQAAMATVDVAV